MSVTFSGYPSESSNRIGVLVPGPLLRLTLSFATLITSAAEAERVKRRMKAPRKPKIRNLLEICITGLKIYD